MALERNPQAAEAMARQGCDVVDHGWRWIDYQGIDEATEREHILLSVETIRRLTGTRPVGWYIGTPGCRPGSSTSPPSILHRRRKQLQRSCRESRSASCCRGSRISTIRTAPSNFVNVEFSLPFISAAAFPLVFTKLTASVKIDGLFTGQLFGPNDSWNLPESGMNFHSRSDVERLLSGWTVLELTEEDRPGKTKLGEDKHWHIFHIIARRMV
jgi:hypothetical protein